MSADQRSETYSNKLKNHGVFQAFLLVPIKLPQQMAGAQYKEQFLLLQTITYPISDNWHNYVLILSYFKKSTAWSRNLRPGCKLQETCILLLSTFGFKAALHGSLVRAGSNIGRHFPPILQGMAGCLRLEHFRISPALPTEPGSV
jgi:hypothetical protein